MPLLFSATIVLQLLETCFSVSGTNCPGCISVHTGLFHQTQIASGLTYIVSRVFCKMLDKLQWRSDGVFPIAIYKEASCEASTMKSDTDVETMTDI